MNRLLLGLVAVSLGVIGACGGDGKPPGQQLFPPKPECVGDPVAPYAGTFPQVINTLAIGSVQDGFDLDNDGKPDNKFAAVGGLANDAITTSVGNYEVIIPFEFFDLPTVAAASEPSRSALRATSSAARTGVCRRPARSRRTTSSTA